MEASRSCSKRKKAINSVARRETSLFHHIFLSPGGQDCGPAAAINAGVWPGCSSGLLELPGAAALQPLGGRVQTHHQQAENQPVSLLSRLHNPGVSGSGISWWRKSFNPEIDFLLMPRDRSSLLLWERVEQSVQIIFDCFPIFFFPFSSVDHLTYLPHSYFSSCLKHISLGCVLKNISSWVKVWVKRLWLTWGLGGSKSLRLFENQLGIKF